jgi:L-asparagine oxygenase
MSSGSPANASRTPAVSVYELDRDEIGALEAAGAKLKARRDLRADPERWALEAHVLFAEIPEPLRRRIGHFARFGTRSGALLVRGLPTGFVPPTPQHASDTIGLRVDAAAAYSIVVAGLGEQIGYQPEREGQLLHNVLAEREDAREQSSTSSDVDLLMHVELAFSDFRPDFVCLLCLRQDNDGVAGTTVSPVQSILARLPDRAITVLRQQRFHAKVDTSFLTPDQRAANVKICIPVRALEGPKGCLVPRVDLGEIEAMPADTQAMDAIELFGAAVNAVRQELRLEPGDLLIVDNMRALHGRTRYAPRYDGADRWLLRSWVVRDLRRSESVRPDDGRVISPDYSGEIAVAKERRPCSCELPTPADQHR